MGGNASTIYENSPTKNDRPHLGRRNMGGNASTIYENSPTKNDQSTRKGQVIAFHSSSSWKIHFETSKQTSKLIVIDFTASWCGPCQFIQPAINEFAQIYKNVDFIKIDVDELNDVSNEFEVQAMPTFILMKRGKEVDKVVGAQRDDLRKKIEKHMF